MSSPNPIDNEELFNSVVLGGVKSPGKVTLSGHDRKVEWDVKAGPGLAGATTTIKSIPPISFTATFYLVKDIPQGIDDFADWDTFAAVVESTIQGSKPKAIEIYHPDLARNGITSVCKGSMGGFTDDGKGGRTIVVTFQEYRPPKPVKVTPLGSITKKPDPDQGALDQLDALTKQYNQTPWQ